jgi:hypothetical protein
MMKSRSLLACRTLSNCWILIILSREPHRAPPRFVPRSGSALRALWDARSRQRSQDLALDSDRQKGGRFWVNKWSKLDRYTFSNLESTTYFSKKKNTFRLTLAIDQSVIDEQQESKFFA